MAQSYNFITDRTIQDVQNKTKKGFYNLSDFERLFNCVIDVAEKANYDIAESKLDITIGVTMYYEIFDLMLFYVEELRLKYDIQSDIPEVPTIEEWNYQKANDLEKILKFMYENNPKSN